MKLRNKKTGEIREDSDLAKMLIRYAMPSYDSIAELCEEWEDYKPAEPLIKDEKIRNAVRAWAGANGSENEAFYICTPFYRMLRISARSRSIEFSNDGSFGQIDFTKGYTIAELCGEED